MPSQFAEQKSKCPDEKLCLNACVQWREKHYTRLTDLQGKKLWTWDHLTIPCKVRFVRSLFNDAVSSSDHMESRDCMIVNNKLESMWKEEVVIISRYLHEGLKKTRKTPVGILSLTEIRTVNLKNINQKPYSFRSTCSLHRSGQHL
jgi:hypothetical protein